MFELEPNRYRVFEADININREFKISDNDIFADIHFLYTFFFFSITATNKCTGQDMLVEKQTPLWLTFEW